MCVGRRAAKQSPQAVPCLPAGPLKLARSSKLVTAHSEPLHEDVLCDHIVQCCSSAPRSLSPRRPSAPPLTQDSLDTRTSHARFPTQTDDSRSAHYHSCSAASTNKHATASLLSFHTRPRRSHGSHHISKAQLLSLLLAPTDRTSQSSRGHNVYHCTHPSSLPSHSTDQLNLTSCPATPPFPPTLAYFLP